MILAALVSLTITAQAPVLAQVTVLEGKYSEGNIIRVASRVKMPAQPASAYRVAVLKAATMAGQKGFTRLAIVKVDDCVSIGIGVNSLPVVQTCKIFGQMVTQGEVAIPRGKDPVRYYSLKKLESGLYEPMLEKEAQGG